MKIFEIADKNLLWSSMNNVNIDVVKDTYKFLLNSLPLIIRLKSPNKSKIILNNVNDFVVVVDKILSITYPDKNDEDIIKSTETY